MAEDRLTEVVGVVVIARGQILLGLRAGHRRSSANCWDVIGGHVKLGETPVDALARELKEEIGIALIAPKLLQVFDFENAVEGRSRLHLFMVDQWHATPSLANEEHTELRWFDPSEAASLPNLALTQYRAVFSSLDTPRSADSAIVKDLSPIDGSG
jgi:mutator protein MutT